VSRPFVVLGKDCRNKIFSCKQNFIIKLKFRVSDVGGEMARKTANTCVPTNQIANKLTKPSHEERTGGHRCCAPSFQ
jgi:hypothetical protein